MPDKLYIFDLDETLFTHDYSKLNIYVRDCDDEIVNSVPYVEYLENDYKLPILADGYSYDFADFASAEMFRESAKPVHTMINMMNCYAKQKNATVEILTARSDLDCKTTFAEIMASFSIDISAIRVRRAGNRGKHETYVPARRKKEILSELVEANNYTDITMFDDNLNNLQEFLTLRETFPHLRLIAYHVNVNSEAEILRRIQ